MIAAWWMVKWCRDSRVSVLPFHNALRREGAAHKFISEIDFDVMGLGVWQQFECRARKQANVPQSISWSRKKQQTH